MSDSGEGGVISPPTAGVRKPRFGVPMAGFVLPPVQQQQVSDEETSASASETVTSTAVEDDHEDDDLPPPPAPTSIAEGEYADAESEDDHPPPPPPPAEASPVESEEVMVSSSPVTASHANHATAPPPPPPASQQPSRGPGFRAVPPPLPSPGGAVSPRAVAVPPPLPSTSTAAPPPLPRQHEPSDPDQPPPPPKAPPPIVATKSPPAATSPRTVPPPPPPRSTAAPPPSRPAASNPTAPASNSPRPPLRSSSPSRSSPPSAGSVRPSSPVNAAVASTTMSVPQELETARSMLGVLLEELGRSVFTHQKEALDVFVQYYFKARPSYTESQIMQLYLGANPSDRNKGLLAVCGSSSWKSGTKLKRAAGQALGLLAKLCDQDANPHAATFVQVLTSMDSGALKQVNLAKHLLAVPSASTALLAGNRTAALFILSLLKRSNIKLYEQVQADMQGQLSESEKEELQRLRKEQVDRRQGIQQTERKAQPKVQGGGGPHQRGTSYATAPAAMLASPGSPRGSSGSSSSTLDKSNIKSRLMAFFGGGRPPKSELEARGLLKPRAFGVALEEMYANDTLTTITESALDGSVRVPTVLFQCCDHMVRAGIIQLQGVFRLSGDATEIASTRDKFDAGVSIDMSKVTPHSVSGLVKLFLRNLPEPLLRFDLYSEFLASFRADAMDKVVQLAREGLPKAHRDTCVYLLDFLAKVNSYAETNMMTDTNISICIAPNILRPKVETFESVAKDTPMTIGVVKHLIAAHAARMRQAGKLAAGGGEVPADASTSAADAATPAAEAPSSQSDSVSTTSPSVSPRTSSDVRPPPLPVSSHQRPPVSPHVEDSEDDHAPPPPTAAQPAAAKPRGPPPLQPHQLRSSNSAAVSSDETDEDVPPPPVADTPTATAHTHAYADDQDEDDDYPPPPSIEPSIRMSTASTTSDSMYVPTTASARSGGSRGPPPLPQVVPTAAASQATAAQAEAAANGASASEAAPPPQPTDESEDVWDEYSDSSGRSYFVNRRTLESRWTKPTQTEPDGTTVAAAADTTTEAQQDDADEEEEEVLMPAVLPPTVQAPSSVEVASAPYPSPLYAGWECITINGSWTSESSGGCYPNFIHWHRNPQYHIGVNQEAGEESGGKTQAVIQLQWDTLTKDGVQVEKADESASAGFYLVVNKGPSYQKLFINVDEIVARSEFETGGSIVVNLMLDNFSARKPPSGSAAHSQEYVQNYVIIPSTYQPGMIGNFKLSVHSGSSVWLKAVDPATKWQETAVSSQWIGETAGGCRNHAATFPNNPAYTLANTVPSSIPVPVLCVLAQPGDSGVTHPIGWYAINPTGKIEAKGAFQANLSVHNQLTLTPSNPLTLVPCTFSPGLEGPFLLRVYAPPPNKLVLTPVD